MEREIKSERKRDSVRETETDNYVDICERTSDL